MKSIANKRKKVKGKKGQKPVQTPPRYTLKKDSLGRRYAIDKRTGQRVSVSKAEKERVQRKKAREVFRGITVHKQPKKQRVTTSRQKRSEAAKKGWETRRRKAALPIAPLESERQRILELGERIGAFAIPEGMRMRVAGGIADRAEIYPLVENAATEAMAKLQIDFHTRQLAALQKRPIPSPTATPNFDAKYGFGKGAYIRDLLAGARDLQDIDQMIEAMAEDPEYDVSARELYTLYFSPEVA
jgi:hypothetical protein